MRKVLCILMVCILFLLTGCSGNTSNQGGKSGPVTITILICLRSCAAFSTRWTKRAMPW